MRGLIAIHDVTPAHGERVEILHEAVRRTAGIAPALLVIPDHHRAWPLREHGDFVEKLRRWRDDGAEILLHGFHHLEGPTPSRMRGFAERICARALTTGEGEFLGLDAAERRDRIEEGAGLLEEILGQRPIGFVAPAWLRSAGLHDDLIAAGFDHEEGHLFVHDLRRRRRIFAPAVTFCGRGGPKTALCVAWAKAFSRVGRLPFDFRLALHPTDLDSDSLKREIWALLASHGARCDWIGYRELLEG